MEPLTTFSPVNSSDFLTRSFSHYPTVILPQYEFETFDKNSDDVSFPSPNKVTTKIVNNGGGYSPSHESSNIHGVSEGLTGCDCIPLSHCNAKPTYGGITTRIVTKVRWVYLWCKLSTFFKSVHFNWCIISASTRNNLCLWIDLLLCCHTNTW